MSVSKPGPTLSELSRRLFDASGRYLREHAPIDEGKLWQLEQKQSWIDDTGYSESQCLVIRGAFKRRELDRLPADIRAYCQTLSDAELMNESVSPLYEKILEWRYEGRAVLIALARAG